MSYTVPPAGLARCPHCGLATFSPEVLSQHLRFSCIVLGRETTP